MLPKENKSNPAKPIADVAAGCMSCTLYLLLMPGLSLMDLIFHWPAGLVPIFSSGARLIVQHYPLTTASLFIPHRGPGGARRLVSVSAPFSCAKSKRCVCRVVIYANISECWTRDAIDTWRSTPTST
jgi:hypothetical protein